MPEITIHRHIAHSEQGLYLLVPFEMPANTARIDVCYSYPKLAREPLTIPEEVIFSKKKRINTVDIGLIAPDGTISMDYTKFGSSDILGSELLTPLT